MAKKTNEPERVDSIDMEVKKPEQKQVARTSKIQVIEGYFDMKYNFRFNTIKCKPELINLVENEKDFKPLDKYRLNSLKRELDANGIEASVNTIKELLESNFSDAVNPIQEYFTELAQWDKQSNYIADLARTVEVVNSEKWVEYLTKWLVAVVANAMTNHGCQNHTCLVLTGGQGKFKTTWLDNLCPKKIQQYQYTGKIDPTNKDSLTYIAEFLFVNIDDQLKQLNKKDENELKNLITAPSVKYRRPYDPYITEYPHLCSFMASVNGNDFLTDPTGSRRFLPFEIASIDINKAKSLNMDQVFMQAYSLFKSGFKYYFNDEEVQELHANNQKFQVVSEEQQLLIEFFKRPENRGEATHYYTNAMIKDHLEKHTRAKILPKKLGEALTHLGFEKWQKTDRGVTEWKYSLILKTVEEREAENKNQTIEARPWSAADVNIKNTIQTEASF